MIASIASTMALLAGLSLPPEAAQKWSYQDCDKKAIKYPYPKDPHGGVFPIGSCPPPPTVTLACANDSKLKAVDAEASTYETGYLHPPKYAIDEHLASRWSSHYSADQWLIIDLGRSQSFQRLYLVWELAHASQYEISTSDDKKKWKSVYRERNGDGFVDVVDAKAKGRYIKIQGIERAKVPGEDQLYGYSLFDVTVCGQAPSAAPSKS